MRLWVYKYCMESYTVSRRSLVQGIGVSTIVPSIQSDSESYMSYTTIHTDGVFSVYYTGDSETVSYLQESVLEVEQPQRSTTVEIDSSQAEIDDEWYITEIEVGGEMVLNLYIHGSSGSHPIHELPGVDVNREHWFYLTVDSESLSSIKAPDSPALENGSVEYREEEYRSTTVDNTVWIEWDADDELKTLLEHSNARLLTMNELHLIGYFELRETASDGINRCPSINHSYPYEGEEYFMLLDSPNHSLAVDKQIVAQHSSISLQNITEDIAFTGSYQPDRPDDLAEHRVNVLEAQGDSQ